LLVLVSIPIVNAGCFMTREMWEQTNRRTIDMPHVVGTVEPDDAAPDARQLVVEYDVMGGGIFKDRRSMCSFRSTKMAMPVHPSFTPAARGARP
jgi:hypothetical protein